MSILESTAPSSLNVFYDQAHFMSACGQTIGHRNEDQYMLYQSLIAEEFGELCAAKSDVEKLDALVDILVVTIGAIHSLGSNAEGAWREVMRSNFSKIDPETGKVNKRDDGKVLKPVNWQPPDLAKFV